MLVLGIESSCDETAAAVVRDGSEVLSNCLHSQTALHERYRGVVPELASRSHTERILPILRAALDDASVTPTQLDGIAVTNRPGMVGSLLVGLSAAKTLALWFEKPLVGVDHVGAHLHAAFMVEPDLPLPCLSLVASGGHTALYAVDAPGESRLLGRTRDDAAGEALDKGAAILGLPYPGGPAIERVAEGGDPKHLALPRPMLGPTDLDFSFSGLKTALLYQLRGPGLVRPMPELQPEQVRDIACSFQEAIVDTLVRKLRRAARIAGPFRSLSIGGGVARNKLLRERLGSDRELSSLHACFPPMDLCSDNGAMIAGLGTLLLQRGERDDLSLQPKATSRPTRQENQAAKRRGLAARSSPDTGGAS